MASGFTKIINESFDSYVKRLTESEDRCEECKEEILDESADISEYQKWVDFDMKKYGKISGVTMNKIKKAGFSVVKDQYGDYEVIADRKDESCEDEAYKAHRRKSMREAAPSAEDVVVGLYGDEVDGIRSVPGLVDYFESKGLKVSNVRGDMDHGWELNITGAPRTIFFAVQNLDIPGYDSDSVNDFISEYRIDDLDEACKSRRRKFMKEAAPKKAPTEHKWGDKSVKSQLALPENQRKLNDMMKSGRNWRDMKNDFVQLIQSLDCTDKNKKQTIMKINGIKNESAFYSTVATYLTGIKAESLRRTRPVREARVNRPIRMNQRKNESIRARRHKVNESLAQRNRGRSRQNIQAKKRVK